jgi:hypothetical protein
VETELNGVAITKLLIVNNVFADILPSDKQQIIINSLDKIKKISE